MTDIDPKALALRVADSMDAYLAADGDERSLPAEFVFSDDEAHALAAFLREAVSPWRPISDEARRADRVLIAWAPFGNIREHVELGWWSAQARAWVNTYGKPFTGEPDAWMPLPAFALPHASGPHRRRRGAQP